MQSLDLAGYLAALPPAVKSDALSSPWTSQALFRALLPLAQQYVLRLLFLDEPVPRGEALCRPSAASVERAGPQHRSAVLCVCVCVCVCVASMQLKQLCTTHVPAPPPPHTHTTTTTTTTKDSLELWVSPDPAACSAHRAAVAQLEALTLLVQAKPGCVSSSSRQAYSAGQRMLP